MTGGGFEASLTELAIARLDTEAMPVDAENPLGGLRCHAPKGINQDLRAMAAALAAPMATRHLDMDGGLVLIGAGG
ncbi:MAG: hypothetical protein ACFCVA_18515 [Gammaproteobacteria bacterium]